MTSGSPSPGTPPTTPTQTCRGSFGGSRLTKNYRAERTFEEEATAGGAADDGGPSADDLRRAMQDAGGELSRTTVRLFNELKSQAERAASDQGVSLNTYISRAVSDSVRSAVPNKGNHRGRGKLRTQRHRLLPRLTIDPRKPLPHNTCRPCSRTVHLHQHR